MRELTTCVSQMKQSFDKSRLYNPYITLLKPFHKQQQTYVTCSHLMHAILTVSANVYDVLQLQLPSLTPPPSFVLIIGPSCFYCCLLYLNSFRRGKPNQNAHFL